MMNPYDFARMQMELTTEFARYVVEHPEVDEKLPAQSYIYFEVAGEAEFNRYSRELAEKQFRDEGLPPLCVRKVTFPSRTLTHCQRLRSEQPQFLMPSLVLCSQSYRVRFLMPKSVPRRAVCGS